MTENREDQRQQLEATAQQILDNPRLLPRDFAAKHFNPTLHLWISPTFTPEKHWVFYEPQAQINPQPKPIVRQFIWNERFDFEHLPTEPTFEIKTVEIELEKLRSWQNQLSKISFPAFISEDYNGRDGEIVGIETLNFFHSAKISWWSEYPAEWQNLVDWYEKVRKFLEENFNDR